MQLSFQLSRFKDVIAAPMVRARLRDCTRAAATAAVLLIHANSVIQAYGAKPRPSGDEVALIVQQTLAATKGYQDRDLISQSQIAAVLKAVEGAGININGAEQILGRGLPDNSFLVRELASGPGRKFMRKINRHPGAYPRLDRLSSISGGEAVVRTLIRDKGGDKLIEYMATTKGGHNLGKMMAGARQGADLNKPTDRVYTAADLIEALERTAL